VKKRKKKANPYPMYVVLIRNNRRRPGVLNLPLRERRQVESYIRSGFCLPPQMGFEHMVLTLEEAKKMHENLGRKIAIADGIIARAKAVDAAAKGKRR